MPRQSQHTYWFATVAATDDDHPFQVPFSTGLITWAKGQKERADSGFLHWQAVFSTSRSRTLLWCKRNIHSTAHFQPSRSQAADVYVHKEDTAIPGTRFELGTKPVPITKVDWDAVWESAKSKDFMAIPARLRFTAYRTICSIAKDFQQPVATVKNVSYFYGETGTGKSKLAWEEAGLLAFPKDPKTKFWDGYNGQPHVIIEEFRGAIAIEHMLR